MCYKVGGGRGEREEGWWGVGGRNGEEEGEGRWEREGGYTQSREDGEVLSVCNGCVRSVRGSGVARTSPLLGQQHGHTTFLRTSAQSAEACRVVLGHPPYSLLGRF